MNLYRHLRPLLFALEAETAHYLTLKSLRYLHQLGLLRPMKTALRDQPTTVMGLEFQNPVGLAAGLDKNGEYIKPLSQLGFGFIEIGTITPKAQPGNPKPRLFRLPKAHALINRLGFNNQGVAYLIEQVKAAHCASILGINIGKNKQTPLASSLLDYQSCFEQVYPYADYVTVNISSPNTPDLRALQYGDYLDNLLMELKKQQHALSQQHQKYVPIAIKIAPDLTQAEVKAIAKTLLTHQIDGVVATNTTIERPPAVKHLPHGEEIGGLSGKPVFAQSTQVVAWLYEILQDDIPIIAVGGIQSPEDAKAKLKAGARLIQLYTGLIYEGPALIRAILSESLG